MLETILLNGPFMVPLIILAIIVIFISIKNIKKQFHTNMLVYCGTVAALLGILSSHIGISRTIKAIINLSDISPILLINGFKISLTTTYFGGIILFFSVILWIVFNKRFNW